MEHDERSTTRSAQPITLGAITNDMGVIHPEDEQMSPRRIRFEAQVFRADSVAFESCGGFRSGEDPLVCTCGWLEEDHDRPTAIVPAVIRHLRRPAVRVPERRAS
jgi:hypothetical protein